MTTRPRTDWQKYIDTLVREYGVKLNQIEQDQAVYIALDKERSKHLDKRFTDIDAAIKNSKDTLTEQISSIRGAVAKMLWVIGGAVILAIVQFILSGGLALSGG